MATLRIADSVGRVLGGRYRLTHPLGTGASAHVYVAEDVTLRRRVAIKILHPGLADDEAFLRRFRAEARVVAALRHPNILRVYDWGEDEGSPYLVTELLEGGSLRAMLDRGYLLTPSQATAVAFGAAEALDHAHRKGLVHRDVKPANLLFDDEGRVCVADFGLARALAAATWTEPAGVVLGTVRYAAPEQVRGRSLDARADIYALAVVMTEATTGVVPFAADTNLATAMARLDTPLVVSDAAGPLRPVLEAAGTIDPEDRLDAAGMVRRLQEVAAVLPPPAPLPLAGALADGGVEIDSTPTELRGPARPEGPEPPSVLLDRSAIPPAGGGRPNWGAPVGPTEPTAGPADDTAGPLAPPADGPGPVGAPGVYDVDVDGGPTGPGERAPGPGERAPGRGRRPWRRVLAVVVVVLLAAGGVAAWIATHRPAPLETVPALVGRTQQQAVGLLGPRHLTLTVVGRSYDPRAPKGTITGQNPTGGRVHEHTVVTVTVSLGPQPIHVPSLGGATQADASRLIRAVGLDVGRIRKVTSITVPAGEVIRSLPPGGTLLPGQLVGLVVSTGKPTVTVPLLQGSDVLSYANAAAALTAAHLVPTEEQAYNNVVPAGEVITTDPGPNASGLYGSQVVVVVSKGPNLVVVPDVSGDTVARADGVLGSLGFIVTGVTGNPGGKVRSTTPAAGQTVLEGSSIQLVTGG